MKFFENIGEKIEDLMWNHTVLYYICCYIVGIILGMVSIFAMIPIYKLIDKIFGTHLYEKWFS